MSENDTNPVNAEQSVTSEPAQSVSEAETSPNPTETESTSEPLTAHMGRSEPLGESDPPPSVAEASAMTPQVANVSAPSQSAQVFVGKDILVKARATIQNRKRVKLEKILEHLNAKNHITNDEVEKLLHVSDATATRYLSQLEGEGKIKQIGTTGKAVMYTKP
jgi:predicted HTH transcriptional regulator